MERNVKTIKLLPLLVWLIIFSDCKNSEEKGGASDDHAVISKVENENKHSFTASDSAGFYTTMITVSGDVEFPLSLTVDSLKKMNVAMLDSSNIVCQTGAVMNSSKSSRGILLKDILAKAGIIQKNHKDRNFYIVARAADGYKATFSWGEIFNNPTGENTYVIFEENNMPISKKGAMVLNSNHDIKTGPRHVYWLKSIEVKRVD